MSITQALFLGAGLGALTAGMVIVYAVATLMPEHRWLR
jgi:hypothetical protein